MVELRKRLGGDSRDRGEGFRGGTPVRSRGESRISPGKRKRGHISRPRSGLVETADRKPDFRPVRDVEQPAPSHACRVGATSAQPRGALHEHNPLPVP